MMGARDMADQSFDPPSVVRVCLNCRRPECNNCVQHMPRAQLHRPSKKKERVHRETKKNDQAADVPRHSAE